MSDRFNFKTEQGLWNIFYLSIVWSFIATLPILIFSTFLAEVVTFTLVCVAALLVFTTMHKLKKLKFPRRASDHPVRLFRK